MMKIFRFYLIFSLFILTTTNVYSQDNMDFSGIYSQGKDILFFKKNKLSFLIFENNSLRLIKQLNFNFIENTLILENNTKIQIKYRNQLNEQVIYNDNYFTKKWNFTQFYTSLGYSMDNLEFKYGSTENTMYLFNDDNFFEFIDLPKIASFNSLYFLEQYINNNSKYNESKKIDYNKKKLELESYFKKENVINNHKVFADSVRQNTFPKPIFLNEENAKNTRTFFIKKDEEDIKIQYVSKFENVGDFYHIKRKLISFEEFNCENKIKTKITDLLSDKPLGLYYLSIFVYNVKNASSINTSTEELLIDVESFFNCEFNKDINKVYKENDIQYLVFCDDCIISYSDKESEYKTSSSKNIKSVWKYNFNEPVKLNEYYTYPLSTKVYGKTGQYVYLRVVNNTTDGNIILKILRDGKIWKQDEGIESFILNGYLP